MYTYFYAQPRTLTSSLSKIEIFIVLYHEIGAHCDKLLFDDVYYISIIIFTLCITFKQISDSPTLLVHVLMKKIMAVLPVHKRRCMWNFLVCLML